MIRIRRASSRAATSGRLGIAVLLAALVALVFASSAFAAGSYVVNDSGDAPDADVSDGVCDTGLAPPTPQCTLRAAIQQANDPTTSPGPDTITFAAGVQPTALAPLPTVTDAVTIDGGGNTTVTFDQAATGALLDIEAANSLVKSIAFTGGDTTATVVKLAASGDQVNAVTVQNSPGTGIGMEGPSERADGVTLNTVGTGILAGGRSGTVASPAITNTTGAGIVINGASVSVSSPEISGAGSDGIAIHGSGASVSGGHIHGNAGNGVGITGTSDVVSRVVFYGNRGRPIYTAPGANGGVAPPANLRIGPRRADGSLPLTGTGSTGQVELWSGDPSSSSAPSFAAAFRISGEFAYNFPSEPRPGSIFALSLTGDGAGSSEFATVRVPDDISSPDLNSARALDTGNVRLDFSEPIAPNSVQKDDFHLTMAGADRAVSAVSVAPDARSITLASGGWRAGEAGTVDVTTPGAVTDSAGNAMVTTPHLRVAAAPGDFIAPLAGSLRVTPKTVCLTRARKCRHPGMAISFVTTEAGKATMLIKRSNKTVGKRLYGNIVAGKNTLKFNGRLGARKLRAGRYRLLIYVQDQVGNVTDQPPIVLFSVRRVTR